jgi:hypothetical protein
MVLDRFLRDEYKLKTVIYLIYVIILIDRRIDGTEGGRR